MRTIEKHFRKRARSVREVPYQRFSSSLPGSTRSSSVPAMLVATLMSTIIAVGCSSNSSSTEPQPTVVTNDSDAGPIISETTSPDTAAFNEGPAKAGFILPNSLDPRWENFDRKFLANACEAAGIECLIENANGDPKKMATIADQMLKERIGVLGLGQIDNATSLAIQQKAAALGVKLIDYDRLTIKGKTDAYVSFDDFAIGRSMGQGVVSCLGGANAAKGKRVIQLHGSPTDNGALLIRAGYQNVLKDSGLVLVGEESVADGDPQKAGPVFDALMKKASGRVDAIISANDAIAVAVETALGPDAATTVSVGNGASPEALRAIVRGTQCMTVYKPIKQEAETAVNAALNFLKNQRLLTNATINDGAREVPFLLSPVTPVYRGNLKDLIAEGHIERDVLCAQDLAEKCGSLGI